MKTIYVSTGTIRDAQERAGRLYTILRDHTPVIAHGNVRDDLNDERELAKYIVDNDTVSEIENIECRR